MGPRCSFCGTTQGPFLQVDGLFTLHMCPTCQAARSSSNRGPSNTRVQLPSRYPDQPAELLAHHDPGQPWYQWGCPIDGCGHRVIGPWELQGHATAEHPGWIASYELVRPYPNQLQRVVFRRVEEPPAS